MKKVTQKEFNELIAGGNYLVDFYADWCGPCKMLAPILEEVEKDLAEKGVGILKVNVDEEPALANEMGIQFIPYVALFVDGKKKDAFSGYKSKADLKAFVESSLK